MFNVHDNKDSWRPSVIPAVSGWWEIQEYHFLERASVPDPRQTTSVRNPIQRQPDRITRCAVLARIIDLFHLNLAEDARSQLVRKGVQEAGRHCFMPRHWARSRLKCYREWEIHHKAFNALMNILMFWLIRYYVEYIPSAQLWHQKYSSKPIIIWYS
jgi:hypothetical protein